MREGAVVLGDVIFEDTEILGKIAFEAAQATPSQRGEADAGQTAPAAPDFLVIKWHGRLCGPSARSRASSLCALAHSLARTSLSCHGNAYEVAVAQFDRPGGQPDDFSYRIACHTLGQPTLKHGAGQEYAAARVSDLQSALRALARALGRQAASSTPPPSSEKDKP